MIARRALALALAGLLAGRAGARAPAATIRVTPRRGRRTRVRVVRGPDAFGEDAARAWSRAVCC